jgi:hypothetical protein
MQEIGMGRIRLDDAAVNRPTSSRLTVLWDTDLYGFGCYIKPHQAAQYFVCFRTPLSGFWRRRKIGSSRTMSCDQARRMAQEIIGRSAPQQLKRKRALRSA